MELPMNSVVFVYAHDVEERMKWFEYFPSRYQSQIHFPILVIAKDWLQYLVLFCYLCFPAASTS